MNLKDQNILFFCRTMGLGGTENVVLQLCSIFKPLANRIVVCSCGGENVKKLEKMNIKHYYIEDVEKKNLNSILRITNKLRKIVSKEHISVIHTHHRMAAFYVEITKLYKRCVFINTCHNTFENKRLFTRIAYSHARLIACGEMVRNNLTEYFGLKNISVICNAVNGFDKDIIVDPDMLKAKKSGSFLVGNIGRLSEQKGMEYFIKAIPLVTSKHPNTRFYIIGAGEYENKLKNMSEGLPVIFMGYREDIQNLMCQLDLVVLSSLWEGLPLTPIEAFSVGKTVVATNVDGTVEIVKDKENGLLVRPRNSKEIADKICWLIENPREKEVMEINAKKTYTNLFSFDRLSRSYAEFYMNI